MVTIIHRFKLKYVFKPGLAIVQVNLCQKLLFLHHLTNNMTTDCSFFMKIVSSEYLQNMLCTQIVIFVCFLTFRTILVHNMLCRCCKLLKRIYLYLLSLQNYCPIIAANNCPFFLSFPGLRR